MTEAFKEAFNSSQKTQRFCPKYLPRPLIACLKGGMRRNAQNVRRRYMNRYFSVCFPPSHYLSTASASHYFCGYYLAAAAAASALPLFRLFPNISSSDGARDRTGGERTNGTLSLSGCPSVGRSAPPSPPRFFLRPSVRRSLRIGQMTAAPRLHTLTHTLAPRQRRRRRRLAGAHRKFRPLTLINCPRQCSPNQNGEKTARSARLRRPRGPHDLSGPARVAPGMSATRSPQNFAPKRACFRVRRART